MMEHVTPPSLMVYLRIKQKMLLNGLKKEGVNMNWSKVLITGTI